MDDSEINLVINPIRTYSFTRRRGLAYAGRMQTRIELTRVQLDAIGAKIRAYRAKTGASRRLVADRAGVSLATIVLAENRRANGFSKETLEKLAWAIGRKLP